MNIVKFAKLIANLSCRHAIMLSDDDITTIADNVQEIVEAENAGKAKIDLLPMFSYMLNGRKIDAIKEHRMLTGFGLKESKDAIDSIMEKFAPIKSE